MLLSRPGPGVLHTARFQGQREFLQAESWVGACSVKSQSRSGDEMIRSDASLLSPLPGLYVGSVYDPTQIGR